MLRPVSFSSKDQGLDDLADELRRSPRARIRARGLPAEDLLALIMKEQAGRTGGR